MRCMSHTDFMFEMVFEWICAAIETLYTGVACPMTCPKCWPEHAEACFLLIGSDTHMAVCVKLALPLQESLVAQCHILYLET